MGFIRRLLGAAGNDANAPGMVVVPKWGPDAFSRRMATLNMLRGNAFSPANLGPGIRPAPPGSSTEGTETNALLPPQQSFKGMAARITNPSSKTIPPVMSFPSTNTGVNAAYLGIAPNGGAPSPWQNWNGAG